MSARPAVQKDLRSLGDSDFCAAWRSMSNEERSAFGDDGFARYRKLTPWVEKTISRVEKNNAALDALAARAKAAGPRFPRVWLDDALVEVSNLDYVKHLIGALAFILVYGPAGDGKTFFIIDLILHIAASLQWRGRKVRQCLTAYVAAEAGTSVIRRFVAARNEHLSDSREGRIPLAIITRGADLLNTLDVESLLRELREASTEAGLPVGIVVFDTFSRSTPGGDENAAQDVTQAIGVTDRIRDELGATTIFVHHSGKDPGKGSRGHSSLFAAADTVISVVEKVATIEKSRDGTAGEQFAFDLKVVELGKDQDGDPITTCIVEPTGIPTARPKVRELSGVAKVALRALQEAVSDHGRVMPETSTIPRGVKAVDIDRWRDQFTLRYGTEGRHKRDADAVRKAFQRGREALLKVSALEISDPYVWLLT